MMRSGPMVRSRAAEKRYLEQRRMVCLDGCAFCDLVKKGGDQVVKKTKHCLIVKNIFSYDIWDGCGVVEHLMVIPQQHTASLADLSHEERVDYMDQLAQFEAQNYSLYARSPGNITKSVTHQHMHLIKIDNKRKKFLFYLRKPHVLFSK
ncbi:MAG: HIT domain-containing protein [Candidatus Saccharibacteria bacterium]|nr:HIT domain-containing protein [Candidatus Saccharibacteria bacterium]